MAQSTSSGIADQVLGVRLSYFDKFIEQNGGLSRFENLTTEGVCKGIVENSCRATRKSICEQLVATSSLDVGTPTWFISHTWAYNFLDTVEAVKLTLQKLLGEATASDTIVWFDLFSLKQAGLRGILDYHYLSTTFLEIIQTAGNLMMVMLPWDNPVTMTRAWCVFEAYAFLQSPGGQFEVAMTQAENDRFLRGIKHDCSIFFRMMQSIDSSKSVATKDLEQLLIHRAIRGQSSYQALDRSIFVALEKWMIKLLEKKIDDANNNIEKASWIQTLGDLYRQAGKLDLVESLYRSCFEIRSEELGKEHPDTLAILNNLANLYMALSRVDEAEPLLKTCLEIGTRILGEEHPSVVTALSNLAGLYEMQGQVDRAEPLLEKCLSIRRRLFGDEDLSTVRTLNNLALVYQKQNKLDQAELLHNECYKIRLRLQSNQHPDTLLSMNNLAGVYMSQGKYDRAQEYFQKCLEARRRELGNDHLSTLTSLRNLANCYKKQKQYTKAEELYLECINGYRRKLGNFHPDTLNSIYALASMYEAQGDVARAQPLLKELSRN